MSELKQKNKNMRRNERLTNQTF